MSEKQATKLFLWSGLSQGDGYRMEFSLAESGRDKTGDIKVRERKKKYEMKIKRMEVAENLKILEVAENTSGNFRLHKFRPFTLSTHIPTTNAIAKDVWSSACIVMIIVIRYRDEFQDVCFVFSHPTDAYGLHVADPEI